MNEAGRFEAYDDSTEDDNNNGSDKNAETGWGTGGSGEPGGLNGPDGLSEAGRTWGSGGPPEPGPADGAVRAVGAGEPAVSGGADGPSGPRGSRMPSRHGDRTAVGAQAASAGPGCARPTGRVDSGGSADPGDPSGSWDAGGSGAPDGPEDPDRPDRPGKPHGSWEAGGPGASHDPGNPSNRGSSGSSGGSGDSSGSGGGDAGAGPRSGAGSGQPARIPLPRASVEDSGRPLPELEEFGEPAPRSAGPVLEHRVLKSLLGAWALAACSAEETAAVEEHLGLCGSCADEALRLREAVGLLHQPESLDLDPSLRTHVLEGCLERRPPRIPVPEWAAPYDAETARLDALLQDIGDAEWHAPVRLRWFEADKPENRRTTVAGVIAHLMAVDGLVAIALGLDDPLGEVTADRPTPAARTEAYWRASHFPPTRGIRAPWREQTHDLVRTVGFTGSGGGRLAVSYGDFELPLHDAMLDRAFECWVHAEDIADAVDYPYEPPSPRHLHGMVDLAARVLPDVLATRRRAGLASPGHRPHLVPAGSPGRSLRLEIEGLGGGEWLIPLDSPGAVGSAEHEVAHVALDGAEFIRLAAGHISPEDAAAGQVGDRAAIRDVLFAAASLSRM